MLRPRSKEDGRISEKEEYFRQANCAEAWRLQLVCRPEEDGGKMLGKVRRSMVPPLKYENGVGTGMVQRSGQL